MMNEPSHGCLTAPQRAAADFFSVHQTPSGLARLLGLAEAAMDSDLAPYAIFTGPSLEEPDMTIEQLQQLAFDFGFGACAPYTSHTQLVRDIQLRRGGEPCFLTERRYSCTKKCEFGKECRKLMAHWMR